MSTRQGVPSPEDLLRSVMQTFGEWVIYGGQESSLSSSADVEAVVAFKVEVGNNRFVAKYAVTFEAAVDRGLAASGDLHELIRMAALEDLEGRLAAGSFDGAEEAPESVRCFGTQDADYLVSLAAGAKQCLWMIDTEPRGHDCGANHVSSGPQTSLPICRACDLPDARLICECLAHPLVGFHPESKGTRRKLLSAMCDAGQEIGLGGDCRPGGRGCWRQRGTQAVLLPAVEADAARKLVDEIDHLCRVYREFYRAADANLWPPAGWRSITELAAPCTSAPEFERQIINLACVLASLNPFPQLTAERATYSSSGKTVGNAEAFARVLEDDHQGRAARAARALRYVQHARNSCFPVHEHREEFAAVLKELGVVAYPPLDSDFQQVWDRVLTTVWSYVRDIRTALQQSVELGASPATDDDTD